MRALVAITLLVCAQTILGVQNPTIAYNGRNQQIGTLVPNTNTVQNGNGVNIGTVDADGRTVRDINNNNNIIGRLGEDDDKIVYNDNNGVVGYLGDGNHIWSNGQDLGHLNGDGQTADNAANQRIGHLTNPINTGIYDANGNRVGNVGANQQVTNAQNQVVGTVRSDGLVQDSNGNVIQGWRRSVPNGVDNSIYDSNGNRVAYVGQNNRVYDLNNNDIGSIGADGIVRNGNGDVYNGWGRGLGNTNGNTIYDTNGNNVGYVGNNGRVYNNNGQDVGSMGSNGLVLDGNGNVRQDLRRGVKNNTDSSIYDSNGKRVGYVSNGRAFDLNGVDRGAVGSDGLIRDNQNNVIQGWRQGFGNSNGNSIYDINGNRAGYVAQNGRVFNMNNQDIGSINANGQVINNSGNVVPGLRRGALNRYENAVYDTNGNQVGTVGSDNIIRNSNNQQIGTVGPNGEILDNNGNQIWSRGWDNTNGNSIYDVNGKRVGYVGQDNKLYNLNNQLMGTLNSNGQVVDTNGNVVEGWRRGAKDNVENSIYDSNGNRVGTVDANGRVHDLNGQDIGSYRSSDGAVLDSNGNPRAGWGRGYARTNGNSIYDLNGNRVATVGTDNKVMNSNGDLIGTYNPNDGFVYNNNGQVVQGYRRGAQNRYGNDVYDANNNLVGTVRSDGRVIAPNGADVGSYSNGKFSDSFGNDQNNWKLGSAGMASNAFYDTNGNRVGYVGSDGRAYNTANQVVGTVDSNGVARDANNVPIANWNRRTPAIANTSTGTTGTGTGTGTGITPIGGTGTGTGTGITPIGGTTGTTGSSTGTRTYNGSPITTIGGTNTGVITPANTANTNTGTTNTGITRIG